MDKQYQGYTQALDGDMFSPSYFSYLGPLRNKRQRLCFVMPQIGTNMELDRASIPQLAETHISQSKIITKGLASVLDAETVKNTHNTTNSQSEGGVSSRELLNGLFSDDFCHVCGAVLQFESQRVSHYEGKRHAQKVRLYLQTKRDDERVGSELTTFQKDGSIDKERFCELCNMVFSSPVVAKSHYDGKVHAKNLRKQGLPPAFSVLQHTDDSPSEHLRVTCSGKEKDVQTQKLPLLALQAVDLSDHNKHCRLCSAFFNNPQVAKQHYSGRKHQRSQARARLLQQLCKDRKPSAELAAGTFICPVCNAVLNSVEMYQAHMQGNQHQLKEMKVENLICKSERKVYDSFQDELADYIQVQKSRGLDPKTSQVGKALEEEQQQKETTKGTATDGDTSPERGKNLGPPLAFFPPPPWCPTFPQPIHRFGSGSRIPEVPSWGRGLPALPVPPPFPSGSLSRSFGGWPHRTEDGGEYGHGRASTQVQSPEIFSRSSSYSSSRSSSSSSSSDHHHRKEKSRRRRRRDRGRAEKAEVFEQDEAMEGEERRGKRKIHRRKGRRHGEERREEGQRAKRRREEPAEEMQLKPGKEGEGNVEKLEHVVEKPKGEKGKPKHKKERRKTKERTYKVDTRTEEEKLWDESIVGLL